MDWGRLGEVVAFMAVLVEDAVAGAVILGADAPDFCARFQVLPNLFWDIMFPTEEVDAVTLADTT